ncbi:hypothetical protein PoB_000165800 [Plakobranchus ocellatus]|uniref:Uncharacterized protein n=1 Tax=Plakobranchus ocellatus TaxID=259542 RepID=A0AAV3XXR7_9GAST|nr:hypothetical protein PoB_000165800 [Plakobranchus ocellatus]
MKPLWFGFLYVASPQQDDFRLLGPPSGQGTGSGARARYRRRVSADLRCRCSTLERLYTRKTLESTWRPPETLWSLYSGRQIHSGVCLAAAKATLESAWRPPD